MDNATGDGISSAGNQLHNEVRRDYDWRTSTPSLAIIETIASVENTDPVKLWASENRTLSDFVDPDALDSLVGDGHRCLGEIAVTIDGYLIRIDDRGLVVEGTPIPA